MIRQTSNRLAALHSCVFLRRAKKIFYMLLWVLLRWKTEKRALFFVLT